MEVKLIRENEDGSADYTFEMTDEERQSLMRWAIIEAIKRGIEEGKKLQVKEPNESNDSLDNEVAPVLRKVIEEQECLEN